MNAVDPNDEATVRENVRVDRKRGQYSYQHLAGLRALHLRLGPYPLKLD